MDEIFMNLCCLSAFAFCCLWLWEKEVKQKENFIPEWVLFWNRRILYQHPWGLVEQQGDQHVSEWKTYTLTPLPYKVDIWKFSRDWNNKYLSMYFNYKGVNVLFWNLRILLSFQ